MDENERHPLPNGELTPPPAEFDRRPAPEYTPPPPEFPPPGASGAPEEARKKRRFRPGRALAAVAVLALTGWLFVRGGVLPAPPEAAAAPEPTTAPEEVTPPLSPTPVPTPSTTPSPTPEPTPTPPPWDVYPLGDGEIRLTVYNGLYNDAYWIDGTGEEGPIKLVETTIPESEFTEFALPYDEVPEFYDPFVFCGFVLHCGSQFDPGFVPGMDSFVVVLGDVLTREDVERVAPNDDGVRYVNIHGMWRDEDKLITDPANYGMPLTLDDGMGNQTIVEAKNPLFSEGYTYLAIYDPPEREGYTFTGWYDEDGKKVDFLNFFQFYNEIETEWGPDYDWANPIRIVLTAGWEKNE